MLGQHFAGLKGATGAEPPRGHDALPFPEEIREDALVHHGNVVPGHVGQGKADRQGARIALHASLENHATGTDALIHGGFASSDLIRRVEQIDVFV